MPGVPNAGGPPPAPNPQPDSPSTSQGLLSAPAIAPPARKRGMLGGALTAAPPPAGQGVLTAGGPAAGDAQAPPQPPPAPTYAQTLAALRHFSAIRGQLQRVQRLPELGKSSVKRQIVDGVAELVADRILTPVDAVNQLVSVPERPFDQKTWLQRHIEVTNQAEQIVLAHYRQGMAGVPHQATDRRGDPEHHLEDIAALMAQYQPRGRNARL